MMQKKTPTLLDSMGRPRCFPFVSKQVVAGAPPSRKWLITEVHVAYVASVLLTIGLYQLSRVSSFFQDYLHTFVGVMFVAIPMAILLPRRESFDDYGLPPQPLLREALFALLVALVVYPPFWIGFRIWWGWERELALVIPPGFWNAALANLVIVALPEELFYRGYLMGRLDLLLKGRVRILGTRVGWSLLITAALFALGHWVVTFDPQRLAVFFPALVFGWMRLRRGSIVAAVVFHALCNIFMDFLLFSYGIMRPQDYLQ
jgi:membrane protease YdiL (CAAX protease family)